MTIPKVLSQAVTLLTGLFLSSCATTEKKRAYCGFSVGGNTILVPDTPRLQNRIAGVVATQDLKSNLPGRKPIVTLLSVSSDLAIVDAITLFSATGKAEFDTSALRSLFAGGTTARADFGARKIKP